MISLKRLLLTVAMASTISSALHAGHEEESWLFNRQGMFKASQGQTEAAIGDFERACQLNPFNDTALTNLACARNNLGVVLAQKKNYSDAIRQFEAAKAQKPEDVSIRLNLLSTLVTLKNGAAVEKEARELIKLRPLDVDLALKVAAAFQKTENQPAAQAILQEMVDRVPDNAILHASLGRLLYRCGNLSESSFHLQRSIELDPADSEVKKFLDRIERESSVEKNSQTYTSVHFSLTCQESFSEEWAEDLLDLLEEAYAEIGDRLGFYPTQRSQVLVMETEDFRRVHDLPDWAGGLYDGKIRLPVPGHNLRPSAMRGAVMHEYTHHVVFLQSSGNCPIWLNEGLAQIFENGSENIEKFCAVEQATEKNYSLEEIDLLFRSSPQRKQAAVLYHQSLSATARLIAEFGWNRAAEFLNFLAMGYSNQRAAKEAFATDFPDLERSCLNNVD